MKMLWFLVAILALLAGVSSTFAQDDNKAQVFAPPKQDWEWDEDKRFDFLVERLASLEASLDAVEKAIAKTGRKAGVRQGDARRAEANNSMMDRKGGGPMKWNEFYGTTAEKFFYHPVDPNTTYHTRTVLRQMGSAQDDKVRSGVPSTQSLPVHQRPPQFDYIYRANRDAKDNAEREAIALAGKVEELNRRRVQLEDEQAELWCLLSFRAIERQNIPKKPMLRFALTPSGTTPDDTQRHEALSAATTFLAVALLVIDKAEQDQATALTGIKEIVGPARSQFDDSLINLDTLEDEAANKKKRLGQFVALAQLLDDTASNLSESYVAAMDGDRFKDEARKDRFRGLLQRSLIEYAQILLAMDEIVDGMRKEWRITVDTKKAIERPAILWESSGLAPRSSLAEHHTSLTLDNLPPATDDRPASPDRSSAKPKSPQRNVRLDGKWRPLITDLDSYKEHWRKGHDHGTYSFDPRSQVISIKQTYWGNPTAFHLGTIAADTPWSGFYIEVAAPLTKESLDLTINGKKFSVGAFVKKHPNGIPVRIMHDADNSRVDVFVGNEKIDHETITDSQWTSRFECRFSATGYQSGDVKLRNPRLLPR
jgi:hypothetical protein